MKIYSNTIFYVIIVSITATTGQFYEDKRCKCVCPSVASVFNSTGSTDKKLFIVHVAPSQCNCDGVILPYVGKEIRGREEEYCLRCECKYEIRNTGVIKVVVILVLCIIMMLVIYMGFLLFLDMLMRRKKHKMRAHRETRDGIEEATNLLEARNFMAYDED